MEVNIIFGAPGCGKTTALMRILENELKENEPNRIAYVSFTRKGTYEGCNRAKQLFGYKDEDMPFFRTLHSIAFRDGKFARSDMMDKEDYKRFSKALGMNFTGYYTYDFVGTDDKYLFFDTLNRENPSAADKLFEDLEMAKINLVCENLIKYKKEYKVVDFTDIINQFVVRANPLPVDIAIIDEAQDLTTLQWKMCRVAFRNCKKVYIAGDDDQAIYEWSGADVRQFISFNGNKTILDKSYRMKKNILEYSKQVSSLIKNRVEKQFDPVSEGGNIYHYNTIDDLKFNHDESYYLLSRNNYFLQRYKELMLYREMLFKYKDANSFNEKEVSVIHYYEKQRNGIKLTEQQEMAVKANIKSNCDLKAPWYESLQFSRSAAMSPIEKVDYYRDLIKNKTKLEEPKIMIDTIHGVKGGEADNVVIMLDFTRAVKKSFDRNADSELRTLYVGLTRAKKNLHIVYSQQKNGYDDYLEL